MDLWGGGIGGVDDSDDVSGMSEIQDEAYSELCEENERLKARLLSPAERGYVLGLLKEHLEYYRTLGGNGKASEATRGKLKFLEKLWMKLV